jgi:hypothetical protein
MWFNGTGSTRQSGYLKVGGKLRVDGENSNGRYFVADLLEAFSHKSAVYRDVLLTSHEDENVAWRMRQVNSDRLLDRAFHIIIDWCLGPLRAHNQGEKYIEQHET